MSTHRRILAILMVFVLIAAFFACSDDDDDAGSNPVIPTEGELTDEQYLFADQYIEPDMMNTVEISMMSSMYLLMIISEPSLSKSGEDMASARELYYVTPSIVDTPSISPEGWYVFDFQSVAIYRTIVDHDVSIDSVYSSGLDSVRLSLEGVTVEWNGAGTVFDQLEYRYITDWQSSNAMSGSCYHRTTAVIDPGNMTFEEINCTINDVESVPYEDQSGFCYILKQTTAEASGLTIEFTTDFMTVTFCVDSGSVSGRTIVNLDCTLDAELPTKGLEGIWDYEGSYDSTMILSHRITHDATYWLAADTCEL